MRCVAALLLIIPFCVPVPVAAAELRIATFNVAMGLDQQGELAARLRRDDDPRLRQLAAILQMVRPDIVLLNEFDYDPSIDAAELLNRNYLDHGERPLHYPYHFRAEVNTGIDSGMDLDRDGQLHGPGDAWGFGWFPGQYGMLLLSRYPLRDERTRSFRLLTWNSLPGAQRPVLPDGTAFYDDATWEQLRLSSKSHWDLLFDIDGQELHLLAFHPTPPVFDGPEDRNGRRNSDEIRLWRDYSNPSQDGEMSAYIVDDAGMAGGLAPGARFVIAGDFNADPLDGDSLPGAMEQLLAAPWIDAGCIPVSEGGAAAAGQGGVNRTQRGDPAADTADFNDERVGNLRLDYLLPSRGLRWTGCGVFWPVPDADGSDLVDLSDHRLMWLDLIL